MNFLLYLVFKNNMHKGRLEAFSDGVFAIIITIMVLELKVPHGGNGFEELLKVLPVFLSYILSFIYVGIYWNNHHHLFSVVKNINGAVLWANLYLLFWLSIIPFATAWMGENNFTSVPMAFYGFVLFMNGVAYTILANVLVKHHGKQSFLAKAMGSGLKGKISLIAYVLAIISTFFYVWLAGTLYVLVAFLWLVPDKRIEKIILMEESKK